MATIAVLGDLCLDIHIYGRPLKLAQEAPWAVTYATEGPEFSLGMAGGVADTLAANGHKVRLVAEVGDDAYGDIAEQLMANAGIEHRAYMRAGLTTLKIRAGAHDDQGLPHIIGRWDRDAVNSREPQQHPRLDWENTEALIVSGYGDGAIERIGHLLADCPPQVLVVADVKSIPLPMSLPCHVDYATPNENEYEAWGPQRTPEDHRYFSGPLGNELRRGLVITKGADGATYYDFTHDISPVHVFPNQREPGRFPCGCGDVFVAKFVDALTHGFDLDHAVRSAVNTASTAACTGCHVWV